jgi:pyridoxal phosphate enzyme (YggS family)
MTDNRPVDVAALEARITRVRDAVAQASLACNRDPSEVTIVAVCKSVGREVVDAAYAAGMRHFGENRVQEALAKFAVPLPSDAKLHLIGQLQTNKAGPAVRAFAVVESVDRPSLVAELAKQTRKLDITLPVLLQVNVAGEEQKAGCEPADAASLIEEIGGAAGLALQGLMTIAPLVEDPEQIRPVFRNLRELRDRLRERFTMLELPVLSMGMSNDFKVAIAEGATHVRIGRAIFGD